MGNIQFDPIVSGVSKRVGNFVYSNWKGINVMRRYNPKRPSATESQIKVREAFRIVVAVWKALPEIMIPVVCDVAEFRNQALLVKKIYPEVCAKYGLKKIPHMVAQ